MPGNALANLLDFRQKHPWPHTMPNVPEDWMGWLCPDTADALKEHLGVNTHIVVECGTWLGFSARAILDAAPLTHLICIDTWMGSPEHWNDKTPDGSPGAWASRLPTLFEVCQRNLWPYHPRVTLVRADSLLGLALVHEADLSPDLIYLDTKHTTGRVMAELSVCLELFPDSPIVGDDFSNTCVEAAARHHAKITGRPLREHGAAFSFPAWHND